MTALRPALTIDRSGDLCARSVQRLSQMTRDELEGFLRASARALSAVVVVPARRPKPEKAKRAPRWRR